MIGPANCDPALMNTRKKEKKKMLTEAKKPKTPSDWVALGEHFYNWVKENTWSLNINDYANTHGYPPYKFKKKWANESEIFKEYLEKCYHITAARRDKYMDVKDKLYLQILKELPQYNWDLRDIEEEQAKNVPTGDTFIYQGSYFPETPEGKKFKEKQIAKGNE